jgi:flagellin-like hook-associated protein FlgL
MRFHRTVGRKTYVEMIDTVTQELRESSSSIGLVSNQIESCIDLMQEEAHTLARKRAESVDTASHQSLHAMR